MSNTIPANDPQSDEPSIVFEHSRLASQYVATLKAVANTVCTSMYVPGLLAFFAWQLFPAYDASSIAGAVYRSSCATLLPLFLAITIRRSLMRKGLAELHLGWRPKICAAFAKTFTAIIWGCLPLRFLYLALETYQGGAHSDSFGRLLFTAAMLILASGFSQTWRELNRWCEADSTRSRMKYVWAQNTAFLLICLAPIALMIMALAGYYFTAVELSARVMWTMLVTLLIALSASVASRLMLITQFRIKTRRREESMTAPGAEEETIDIQKISDQVNRLLRVTAMMAMVLVGWQIWNNVIPDIAILDHALWENRAEFLKTGETTSIAVKHLLLAIATLGITYVLSRNLPGLLEITLLDRLPLDKGGRYAISFVSRYIVGIIGTLSAFQMIGFSWSSLNYLAAGLTLGLGFGLQAIFANLVSGIIILIERPVRVGDLVTVNGVTGTVTQMQLRATTIKDLDHRELIVPNKTFITEDVMNWTLSDRRSRLIFAIGVAYGSDTKLVQETLLTVAKRNPYVLRDPTPEVIFKTFGDSTLNFELRVVIPTRDNYSLVLHQINMAIDEAFREKDIEIAFPQQDVNLKGIEQLINPDPDNPTRPDGSDAPANRGDEAPTPNRSSSSLLPNLVKFAKGSPSPQPGIVSEQPDNRDDRKSA